MMTLRTKLLNQFRRFGYRHAYVDTFIDSFIATQIKALREQRELTQTELAKLAGMRQSQISDLEDVNNSSWKIRTLKKLAKAFDLVLVVRFESFGKILPDIETFGRAMLERPSFNDDPVFTMVCSEAATSDAPQTIDTPIHADVVKGTSFAIPAAARFTFNSAHNAKAA